MECYFECASPTRPLSNGCTGHRVSMGAGVFLWLYYEINELNEKRSGLPVAVTASDPLTWIESLLLTGTVKSYSCSSMQFRH